MIVGTVVSSCDTAIINEDFSGISVKVPVLCHSVGLDPCPEQGQKKQQFSCTVSMAGMGCLEKEQCCFIVHSWWRVDKIVSPSQFAALKTDETKRSCAQAARHQKKLEAKT